MSGQVQKYKADARNDAAPTASSLMSSLAQQLSNLHALVAGIENTLSDKLSHSHSLSATDIHDLQRMDYLRQSLKDSAAIAAHLSDHVKWTTADGPNLKDLMSLVDLRDSLFWHRNDTNQDPHQQDIWF